MKKRFVIVLSIAFSVLMVLPLIAYFNKGTVFSDIIKYYADSSSFVIAVLTLGYVITTLLQFSTMRKQLNMMDNSLKLQQQPLIIPEIETFKVEKMKPYCGPEDGFTSIIIMNRIHSSFTLRNKGYGIPNNIIIFPTLVLSDGTEIPQPYIRPNKISIICDSDPSENNRIMFFDDKYRILNDLEKINSIHLRVEILYKNIFGAGFYNLYSFVIKTNNISQQSIEKTMDFITNELPKLKVSQEKHRVLKHIDEKEADEIFGKMRDSINAVFTDDINLEVNKATEECVIEIVDFDDKFENLKNKYSNLVEKNYKQQFDMFNRYQEQVKQRGKIES